MSDLRLVTSSEASERRNFEFSDRKNDLVLAVTEMKTPTEAEELITTLNQLMQETNFTSEEKLELKKIRQRAYDKKKQLRLFIHDTVDEQDLGPSLDSRLRGNDKIEYSNGKLVKTFYGLIAVVTTWFLWNQSIDLYSFSGFADPKMVAFGAILMMLGFASIHAVSKSKLALLLCLYSSGYEIAFIVSGTMKNESVVQVLQLAKDPQLVWLKEKVDRASSTYQSAKSKFEDPGSKVFNNGWYKAKYMDPSWLEYSNAQKDFDAKRSDLVVGTNQDSHVTWLKVMYRLGLVFLAMLTVHILLRCKFLQVMAL